MHSETKMLIVAIRICLSGGSSCLAYCKETRLRMLKHLHVGQSPVWPTSANSKNISFPVFVGIAAYKNVHKVVQKAARDVFGLVLSSTRL